MADDRQACREGRCTLDFWSSNNYAIAGLDSELNQGTTGSKHQAETGLPVIFQRNRTRPPGTSMRAPRFARRRHCPSCGNRFLSGTMGVHIFTWNARTFFLRGLFPP